MPDAAPRVLVVDDDRRILEILHRSFAVEGWDAWEVSTASDAIQVLEDSPPDVVVLEPQLPDANGFEVLERANRDFGGGVPVLCFSAFRDPDHRRRAEELGCAGCITKPAPPEAVLEAVRRTLPPLRRIRKIDRR